MSDDEKLHALELRVMNGTYWLDEHDPTGAFHLWFQARILPAGIVDPAQRAAYAEYHKQRVLWERLDAELARLEGQAPPKYPSPWQSDKTKRPAVTPTSPPRPAAVSAAVQETLL